MNRGNSGGGVLALFCLSAMRAGDTFLVEPQKPIAFLCVG